MCSCLPQLYLLHLKHIHVYRGQQATSTQERPDNLLLSTINTHRKHIAYSRFRLSLSFFLIHTQISSIDDHGRFKKTELSSDLVGHRFGSHLLFCSRPSFTGAAGGFCGSQSPCGSVREGQVHRVYLASAAGEWPQPQRPWPLIIQAYRQNSI